MAGVYREKGRVDPTPWTGGRQVLYKDKLFPFFLSLQKQDDQFNWFFFTRFSTD